MITTVFIKDKHYGWEEPITVQRFDKDDKDYIIWCNHTQAECVEQERVNLRIDEPDQVLTDKIWVCKCGAYKLEYDDYWWDAPVEGITQ